MTGALYGDRGGEPVVLIEGMALLLGVTPEQIKESMAEQGAPDKPWAVPVEWQQQGRRIARETQAATGSTSIKDALDHLAAKR